MPGRRTVEHLLLGPGADGLGTPDPADPALAALAAELGLSAGTLAELLALASGERPDGLAEAVRLALPAAAGPRAIVAVALPTPQDGPGAPSGAERHLEAGLRLGAAASGGPGGAARIWWTEPPVDGDRMRDALWRGVGLGGQRPARGAEPGTGPVFADGAAASERVVQTVEAIAWVRALVERPANLLGPEQLAEEIREFAARSGDRVSVEVWAAEDAARRGFGALAAVGGGSARPPCVVRMRWGGEELPGERVLGLVGKGVAFDAGGIDIKKDPVELAWMKTDMAAAAAVAAALVLAARQAEPGARAVEAILPLCDNAVSGASARPGDVIAHPGGRTSEIVDTDSEGRLLIADGIAWCRQQGYGAVIDAGTLTDGGAGLRRTGLWSNDAGFAASLVELGGLAADPLWTLPLPYGEDPALASRVAEASNAPLDRPDVGRHAALYLAAFAEGAPWAHLDIGGTAYLEHGIGGWPEGPTGAPTAALAEAILDWVGRESR